MKRRVIVIIVIIAVTAALVGCSANRQRDDYVDALVASLSGGAGTKTTIELSTRSELPAFTYEMAAMLIVEEIMAWVTGEELEYNLLRFTVNTTAEIIDDGENIHATILMPDAAGENQKLLEVFIDDEKAYIDMGVVRDMVLSVATRPPATEAEAIISGMATALLTEYIRLIEYVTIDIEELEYFNISPSKDNIVDEARDMTAKMLKDAGNNFRKAMDSEYEIEENQGEYMLGMTVQMFNRVLREIGLPVIEGYQGRVTSSTSENGSWFMAELLDVTDISPSTVGLTITKESYIGEVKIPSGIFMQTISEIIFITGILEGFVEESPRENWNIFDDPDALESIDMAYELMLHPITEYMYHIAHVRITDYISDTALLFALADCSCNPIKANDLFDAHIVMDLEESQLLAWRIATALTEIKSEIVALMMQNENVPSEYALAMSLIVNKNYVNDYFIAQYSARTILYYWNEDIEQALKHSLFIIIEENRMQRENQS